MDEKKLREMRQEDFWRANAEELADISKIEVDTRLPVQKRVEKYVGQVRNPYLVRVGEYIVKIEYSDCKETLNDRMEQYISKIAETKY